MRPSRLLVVASLLVLVAGCVGPGDAPAEPTSPTGPTPPTGEPRDAGLAFDGARALADARAQVERPDGTVRHRVPGTEGNREAAALIADGLRAAGFDVRYHHFNATYACNETPMHNVVGVLPGRTGEATWYVGAHYDSRPVAEKDENVSRRGSPIPGANDGASGVGVLLELARALASHPRLDADVALVFFDGEDGGDVGAPRCDTEWILGSRAFAASLDAGDVARARGMMLVDMVGDPDLRLPREGHSAEPPNRALGDRVWAVAGGLGYGDVFVNETSYRITDDHVPFIERGVPAIDLIDLRKGGSVFTPTHHTHADDVDRLSAVPMQKVGRTLERFLLEAGAEGAAVE